MAPGRHPYGRPKVMTHLPRKNNAPAAAAILHRRASLKHKTNNDDIIPKLEQQFAKQCLKANNEHFSIALFNFALVFFLCKAR